MQLTFKKDDVLTRIKTNREQHRSKVEKLWENYHTMIVAELERRLDQAKQNKTVDPGFMAMYPIPQDFTKEYDRIIDRLESSTDKEITLTEDEFNQWMRDEWRWQERFAQTASAYNVG